MHRPIGPSGLYPSQDTRMTSQTTIKTEVTVDGRGLFSGEPCRLRLRPAAQGTGIVFVRSDLPEPVRIPTDLEHLTKRERRTSLTNGSAGIETVEHVLSAIAGLGVDNVEVEINAGESPSTDGSPLPFAQAIAQAGVVELPAPRRAWIIDEPIAVADGGRSLAALPGPTDCLEILFEMDYSPLSAKVGRQIFTFRLGADDYLKELAPARTFLLEAEAQAMQAKGYGKHLTPKEMLVMSEQGPLGGNSLRFEDEGVRHKVCDLIGDLALIGRPIYGRIVASRSGHELNHALARKIAEHFEHRQQAKAMSGEPAMDIYRIMRLLPHRYPFLMVDRIIEIEGDRRAVGIKNVSINEPFFQGHYPNLPVMPGVLIIEALAQLSGILLSRRLEHTGRVAFLVSMDRVKIRRQVRPGDQLRLQAEALHVRTRTGHCRCQAFVGQELAAEAEIKFMLVDAETSS